ncbi:MAG: hypothetical protein EHM21_01225 [Chloroflexi bacterium]|nr:MAG: hypothetical protein EHM21_01225 [Chloroflexota bacterium]
MKLTAPDTSFYLTILGYQYPDAAGEPYDANWLSIHVEASGPDGAWTGTDPCLLTYETARLADWLEAVATGADAAPAISFLEPVLLFRLVNTGQGKTLRVHFGNLINPSWRQLDGVQSSGASPDLWLDFPLAETDLIGAALSLRQQLKRYPDRAEQ